MRPYIVRQGDHIAKLADREGFDADEVWSHARHGELRDAGRAPGILHPGDVLQLPDRPPERTAISLGGENALEAHVPRVPLRVRFEDASGSLANRRGLVRGAGEPVELTSGSDGAVDFEVPVDVAEVEVVFFDPEEVYLVRVGHIDPITESSGVETRLAQLGYLTLTRTASAEEREALVYRALARFQGDRGLPVSGEADDATRAALRETYGC